MKYKITEVGIDGNSKFIVIDFIESSLVDLDMAKEIKDLILNNHSDKLVNFVMSNIDSMSDEFSLELFVGLSNSIRAENIRLVSLKKRFTYEKFRCLDIDEKNNYNEIIKDKSTVIKKNVI
jgi:hypothetical protein